MNWLLYLLAAMWAIGTIWLAAGAVLELTSTPLEAIGAWCIVLPLWALIGVGPIALIHHENGPELATLLKSEWQCAASHQVTSTAYVNSGGNVMTPIESSSTVCDLYSRK